MKSRTYLSKPAKYISSNPEFTVIIARSRIRKLHTRNSNAPKLNKYMFRGSIRRLVQTAPARVITVATHFMIVVLSIWLVYHTLGRLSRTIFGLAVGDQDLSAGN
jgi:hypothetical protein